MCLFVKVATNLECTDTNRANASYMLTLLRAFLKLFVALLFIYLTTTKKFFADGIRMLVNVYTIFLKKEVIRLISDTL